MENDRIHPKLALTRYQLAHIDFGRAAPRLQIFELLELHPTQVRIVAELRVLP